jgi:hypothetical protein
MKTSNVFSTTTKGSSSVDDCSVESEDSYGGREQTATTPALLVKSIKFSGVTAGSMINLTVPVLPDLYLETITLIKGGAAAGMVGTLSTGTLKKRGSASATIGAEFYDLLLSRARASKLLVALEYDQTRLTKIRFEHV